MKKENRKAAQERRAKERAAEERRRKIIHVCVPVIIIAAVAVLVVGIVVSGVKASNASKAQSESVTGTSGAVSSSVTGDTTASSLASSSVSAASSSAPTLDTEAGLTAKAGDTVNIDYVGKIDGKEFDGGSTNGQGTDLTLGSGTYIDNFEEQIEGHVTGETFDVTVTFPDDYGVADLRGKTAVFTTTLNGIYR